MSSRSAGLFPTQKIPPRYLPSLTSFCLGSSNFSTTLFSILHHHVNIGRYTGTPVHKSTEVHIYNIVFPRAKTPNYPKIIGQNDRMSFGLDHVSVRSPT